MFPHQIEDRYDVVIAGARCAGSATAMLLARAGLKVLVVDPARPGSDTLSTHALMRGAVVQLQRWGLLDRVKTSGAPPIHATSFHYGGRSGAPEVIRIPISSRDGVDALYGPRRTELDPILQKAATEAGATVLAEVAVANLVMDRGRVRGVALSTPTRGSRTVAADLVIGADGVRSKVARLVGADIRIAARHTAATVYGYWPDPGIDGYVWTYRPGISVGAIPTHGGRVCVFTAMPVERFAAERGRGNPALHQQLLAEGAPELVDLLGGSGPDAGSLRAFAGIPGFLRRSAGPGWALVGDAGYFRDPITAHGITDAFRDAELLARAVTAGTGDALLGYVETRDDLVRGFLEVTDRIASFGWDIDEVKELHLELSRSMKRQVAFLDTLVPTTTAATSGPLDMAAAPSALDDVGAPGHLDGTLEASRRGALRDVRVQSPVDLFPSSARR